MEAAEGSNRLVSGRLGSDPPTSYAYTARGAMTTIETIAGGVEYDFRDQIRHVGTNLAGGAAHYLYDGSGRRVRKVVEKVGTVEVRSYVGGYEEWERRVVGTVEDRDGELVDRRTTVHVMDGERRVGMIEVKTHADGEAVSSPTPIARLVLGNLVGSAMLEVTEAGEIISYEEYHPYGTTVYWLESGDVDVSPRRYRYTGQERDEETGLQYHWHRYYAPWLGRWTSADPAGLVDGGNVYAYCGGKPTGGRDATGLGDEFDFEHWAAEAGAQQCLVPEDRAQSDEDWGSALSTTEPQEQEALPSAAPDSGTDKEPESPPSAAPPEEKGFWEWIKAPWVGADEAIQEGGGVVEDFVVEEVIGAKGADPEAPPLHPGAREALDGDPGTEGANVDVWQTALPEGQEVAARELVRAARVPNRNTRIIDLLFGFGGGQRRSMAGLSKAAVRIHGHHTVPREILKLLPDDVASNPLVRGRPGAPNVWPIPAVLHESIHRGKAGGPYNEEFKRRLAELEGRPTVDDVLHIRDDLVKQFGLEGYRP